MRSAEWIFTCFDNGGKRQYFTVSAPDKSTAAHKGLIRARRNAAGDVTRWECKLKQA